MRLQAIFLLLTLCGCSGISLEFLSNKINSMNNEVEFLKEENSIKDSKILSLEEDIKAFQFQSQIQETVIRNLSAELKTLKICNRTPTIGIFYINFKPKWIYFPYIQFRPSEIIFSEKRLSVPMSVRLSITSRPVLSQKSH